MGTLFINELHYDNTGADIAEFIEVAGPAGMRVDGYSVLLYNGNNGESYGTVLLSGVLADERDGHGALSFSPAHLQNGPDGLLLLDPTGARPHRTALHCTAP